MDDQARFAHRKLSSRSYGFYPVTTQSARLEADAYQAPFQRAVPRVGAEEQHVRAVMRPRLARRRSNRERGHSSGVGRRRYSEHWNRLKCRMRHHRRGCGSTARVTTGHSLAANLPRQRKFSCRPRVRWLDRGNGRGGRVKSPLVCGASGFIGQHRYPALGDWVRGAESKRLESSGTASHEALRQDLHEAGSRRKALVPSRDRCGFDEVVSR